ncbi:MAG TPA: hypothetical protein VK254_00770 [Candidatus Bathyarchaeia archaeon]|nr:hypothetical protein [Candidatus Bathyarchaeia archaeon]HLP49014.1 hypothetical protein [Candidatus Kapabacteria bacterium]
MKKQCCDGSGTKIDFAEGIGSYPADCECHTTCPTCKGSGRGVAGFAKGIGSYPTDCKTCGGKGKVPVRKTGNLSVRLQRAACCISEISDFDDHCAAYSLQEEILRIFKEKGVEAAAVFVEEHKSYIDDTYRPGKAEELLALLKEQ